MSKILFFSLPAFGHINPTMGLVNKLIRQGEEVTYYTSSKFQSAVSSTGARVFQYDPYFSFNSDKMSGSIIGFIDYLIDITEKLLAKGFVDAMRHSPADYIIFDRYCLWAPHISEKFGLPSICCIPTIAFSWKLRLKYARIRGAQNVSELKDFAVMFRTILKAIRIARRYGCRVRSMLNPFGNLNIVYTSRYFQPYGNSFGERYIFIGPSIGQRDHTEVPDPPLFADAGGKKRIYISLGTLFNRDFNFYRICFSALGDIDCVVLLSTGGRPTAEIAKIAPANFVIRDYVPQLEVLKTVDLFITHGGTNSVHEALLHRVPLIVVPQGADSFLLGWRVQELGAGRMIRNREFTVSNLRQAVNEILMDSNKRESCEKIALSFTKIDGYLKAWTHILKYKEMNAIK
jgi:MGT family glycosyltransferase